MYTGPRVFNDFDLADMYAYVDTANDDCWDGTWSERHWSTYSRSLSG